MSFNRIHKEYIFNVPEPIVSKNKISGTINEADTEDRTIWAYDRRDGELLGSTIVNRDTRQWELYIDPAHEDESITLICRDESPNYNGDIFDRVSLCRTEYPYPAGIMGLLMYPETRIFNLPVTSQWFNSYCSVEVPELKGDIAKVVQDGALVDKAYPLKFVNSAGNEIVNDITSNNVIINDDSVVLNKITRAPNLVSWRKDIFEDGSEFFHPIWDGKVWRNYYDNIPLESTANASPDDIDVTCTTGKFYESAICLEGKQGITALQGMSYCGNTEDVNVMSLSFWYRSNGSSGSNYTNSGNHYAIFDVVSFTDNSNISENTYFRFGIGLERYYWSSVSYGANYYLSTRNNVSTGKKTMSGSFSFADWHHIVIIQTATFIDLYIDKVLVASLSVSNLSIGNVSRIRFGKSNQNSDYSNEQVAGIYSNVRAFKKAISTAEIEQLYDDVPSLDMDVKSIKGMEYDSAGMLCLGGVPYTPVISTNDQKKIEYADGTIYYVYKGWVNSTKNYAFAGELAVDYIRFYGNTSTAGYYTGLSSRPDTDVTQDMGFSLDNIDVYIRCYLEDTGYVLKLGNATNSMQFYWYNNSNGMMIRFRRANGQDSGVLYTKIVTSTTAKNKWIRIKWIQDKIYYYEDDGTTLIGIYTIPNFSMYPETKGQISVGCNRGGSMDNTGTTDYYGGCCRISDVYIYEKDKMGIDEPIKKYEFGFDRDVFGGLYVWAAHNWFNKSTFTDIDNIQELSDKVFGSTYNMNVPSWNHASIFNERGFTFAAHTFTYTSTGDEDRWPIAVGSMFGFGTSCAMRRYYDRSYFKNVNSIANNSYIDIGTYRPATIGEWNHVAMTYNQEESNKFLYVQGFPINGRAVVLTTPNFNTNKLGYNANGKTVFSNLAFYPVVLSPKSVRNASQNYSGKCYKNEMLVAFMSENTEYPIYANTPLTKINVQGSSNGQVLTFACTKNNTDYYVFTTEWKKILTKEGDFWKYWDGSVWQNGGIVKWKAASMAMDIPDNQMSLQKLNSLTAVQLNTLHDLNNGTFNLAIGMKSNGKISPYIERILYNNEKVWLSPVYDLADFEDTQYITKVYLSKILVENKTDGIKLFVHNSNELGWIECPNFQEVPGIIKNTTNTGTIQFKVTFDQSKDNAKETALLEVTIK